MNNAATAAPTSADAQFVRTLLRGLPQIAALLVAAGVLICTLRVSLKNHRGWRVVLGAPAICYIGHRASKIYNANECFCGTVGVATLFAFNTPLRAFHFLADKCSYPSWYVFTLVIVPANHKPVNAVPTTSATTNALSAILSFSFASSIAHILPMYLLKHSIVLATLVVAGTYGFTALSTFIALLLGVPVGAPFSYPFSSTSLAQFWAYRWNACIASALRVAVHDPLYKYGRGIGTIATFTVSGIAHVIILRLAAVDIGTFKWFAFFFLHGFAVCLERIAILRFGRHSLPLRLLAVAFAVVTTRALFLDVITENPRFERVMWELGTGARCVAKIRKLL